MRIAAILAFSATLAFSGLANTFEMFQIAFDSQDGGKSVVLYGAILEHLKSNPKETLEWLGKHDPILNEMVGGWSKDFFTDYTGSSKESLLSLKNEVCRSLKKAVIKKKELSAARKRLLDHLDTVSVHIID